MEIPGSILFLLLGSVLHCLHVQGQIAPECSYIRESYYSDIWISAPPLLIEDTSLTVYFCSDSYFFDRAYKRGGIMRAAITEPGISSTWNYTDYLISCYRYECREFYYKNVTNYLVTRHTFTSLRPNTLYSLEFLGCFSRRPYFYSCTVENSYFSYRVNITTRPEAPQFQWLTTAETIQIHFQADYFTGPAPDGHEVLVWQKTGAAPPSTAPALSHYFPLSTLNATVEGLLPNTEYFLYVRANGAHFANNQGSWVRREVKTRPPLEPGVPTVSATVSRDTAVMVKLTPAKTLDLIEQCLVSVRPTTGSDATGGTEAVVDVSGSVLSIEGLLPGTEYSYRVAAMNGAGRSNFTEWVRFTTTDTVGSAVTGSSITLLWATPQSVDEASIASYVITLSPVQDTADAVTYTLPGSRQSAALGDLHPGVTYQVQLKTETTSGFQPFYTANVTTSNVPSSTSGGVSELPPTSRGVSVLSATSGSVSELAWGGGGASVMLVIVLVVCSVPLCVCCIVWRRMKKGSRRSETLERPKEVAVSNPNHYLLTEGRGISGNGNEIEMEGNPAYATCGVQCTADEVRYHVHEEVEQLRRGRVVREGGGRGGKEGDRECGGGRGGQARNEIEAGGHEAPMYANIKVVV